MSVLKVLWVEDQPSENKKLMEYIEASGCVILHTGTVADALGVLQLGAPDRLIVDLDVPLGPAADNLVDTRHNGYYVIEHVMNKKLMPATAIVCVTHHKDVAQRLFANTPVRVVTKWNYMQVLADALRSES